MALDLTVNRIPKTKDLLTEHTKIRRGESGNEPQKCTYVCVSGLEELCVHATDRHNWDETIEHTYTLHRYICYHSMQKNVYDDDDSE